MTMPTGHRPRHLLPGRGCGVHTRSVQDPCGGASPPRAADPLTDPPGLSAAGTYLLAARAAIDPGWPEHRYRNRQLTSQAVVAGMMARHVGHTDRGLGVAALTAELAINRRLAHGRIP
jgi:hypothetical protein